MTISTKAICTDIIIEKIKCRDPHVYMKVMKMKKDKWLWDKFNAICEMHWHDVEKIIRMLK